MKLRTLILILTGLLIVSPNLVYSGDTNRPRIQVEVVPSDVRGLKVDLFTVVSNPNDFDVYVGGIGSSSIQTEGQNIMGDGFTSTRREDFFLIPAKGKRIRQLQLAFQLRDGFNHFKVDLAGSIDPKAKLPSNYIPFGTHHFEFTIGTEGSK